MTFSVLLNNDCMLRPPHWSSRRQEVYYNIHAASWHAHETNVKQKAKQIPGPLVNSNVPQKKKRVKFWDLGKAIK